MKHNEYELFVNFSENVLKYKLDTLINFKRELGNLCNSDNLEYNLIEEAFDMVKFAHDDFVDLLNKFATNTNWKHVFAEFDNGVASSSTGLDYFKLMYQYMMNEELPLEVG